MLLDSNIIIYSVQPEYQIILEFLSSKEDNLSISIVSKIEVLGYHDLSDFVKENLQLFFSEIPIINLSDEIAEIAIQLRQKKKMTLGDSIIAATAIHKNIPLLTNNIKDFKHIENLVLISLNDIIGGNKEAVIS
ncbi:MAG TPA: type II toxin-antitoxin system VapC family toxin [Chitinophagales bacterium]|jgi:predicted nucleic acid-binding protein|nr:type II toxin-antitoxin system VapC family toxin [Chitinophagales bacterium]